MTIRANLPVLAAVLATYAPAAADIQSRNLELQPQVRLELADGREVRCKVLRWDGFGLDGSCGAIGWESLRPGPALIALKVLVSERDADACADAAAVVVSLDPSSVAAKTAMDWARRCGASDARLDAARREAGALAVARAKKLADDRAAAVARLTPEAAAFPTRPWPMLHSQDVESVSAAGIEAARALLARTGGSATLHETAHIALLAESGDQEFVRDAASLERQFRDWRLRFEQCTVNIAEQGMIPVVVVSDRDRWRLLLHAAFGGDAAQHPDAVTVYPSSGQPAEPRPIVLVRPDSDPMRQRYNASLGLARAVLHLAGSPERGPAWLNEGLPRLMATTAVPAAGMDAELRKRGLKALRGGAGFGAIVGARYGDAAWTADPELARSLSYLLTSWLDRQAPDALLRYAESPRTSEGEAARFKRHFGMTIDEACARASAWFATND